MPHFIFSFLLLLGFPIRIGIVGGRISNTIQSNIRIVRISRISGQFHVKWPFSRKNRHFCSSKLNPWHAWHCLQITNLRNINDENLNALVMISNVSKVTLKFRENVKKGYI